MNNSPPYAVRRPKNGFDVVKPPRYTPSKVATVPHVHSKELCLEAHLHAAVPDAQKYVFHADHENSSRKGPACKSMPVAYLRGLLFLSLQFAVHCSLCSPTADHFPVVLTADIWHVLLTTLTSLCRSTSACVLPWR